MIIRIVYALSRITEDIVQLTNIGTKAEITLEGCFFEEASDDHTWVRTNITFENDTVKADINLSKGSRIIHVSPPLVLPPTGDPWPLIGWLNKHLTSKIHDLPT